jgi:hypothetical protein
VDTYLGLLAALPRRERYLFLLPPALLTRREIVIALRVHRAMREQLDRYEAWLRAQLDARGTAPTPSSDAHRGLP